MPLKGAKLKQNKYNLFNNNYTENDSNYFAKFKRFSDDLLISNKGFECGNSCGITPADHTWYISR